jgi:hypothetical protein
VVTAGLAAIALAVPLVVAPPWVVLNPSPRLSVSPHALTAKCVRDQDLGLIIENTGAGTLTWHFAFPPEIVTEAYPENGSLPSGKEQVADVVVIISASSPTVPQEVSIEIESNGGNQHVTVTLRCSSTG